MADIDIPHLALPLRLAPGGSLAVLEQDTTEEIEACVEAIIRTPLGFRDELPEFGIPEQAFLQGGPDLAGISRELQRWEPRAEEEIGVEGIEEALVRIGLKEE